MKITRLNPEDPRLPATHVVLIDPVDLKAMEEARVRELRDHVYGNQIGDKEWENCKGNWLQPSKTAWLVEQLRKRKP